MFAQLIAIMQQRELSLDKLFSHEFHFFAPSLSNFGEINLPSAKASLMHEILTKCYNAPDNDNYDTLIMDGAFLVHFITPFANSTFKQYANKLYDNLKLNLMRECQRVDLVFDVYIENSLKAATRAKRGKGVRRRVAAETKIPGNWSNFLRDEKNKQELFSFLAQHLISQSYPEGKIIFITEQDKVLCNLQECMPDSSHEEADTRMCLHLQDALSKGMRYISVACADTDVLIVLLGIFHRLQSSYNFTDIIFQIPRAKDSIRVGLKSLAERLGQSMCQALPFLHALTGSDTTSAFKNIGKKKGYDILKTYKDALVPFSSLYMTPFQNITLEMDKFKVIQRFVVLMYAKTSDLLTVNSERMDMFFKKNQNLDIIPPTENALLQHCKRAIYQTGVWSRCLEPNQNLPSPSNFGWKR